ncbi:uncharacterized protein H6S33_007992 [Morchella sextelata]|uniref:uncharacterized protein n=1 Tax=Morchella sextelata TaxID=1174677 RepID=UPI001D041F47|nr:uncharacterized protein H6S33_007992 [Morchella sextelata]KAH0602988.1 hypothetical protein H6S33_007992 [Morchella sextelata]
MSSSKQIDQSPLQPVQEPTPKGNRRQPPKTQPPSEFTGWDRDQIFAVTKAIHLYWKTLMMYIKLVTGAGSEQITWGPMWDIKRTQLEQFKEYVNAVKVCFAAKQEWSDEDHYKYWDLMDEYRNANIEFSVLLNTHIKYIPLNIAITKELEELETGKKIRRASIVGRRSTPPTLPSPNYPK